MITVSTGKLGLPPRFITRLLPTSVSITKLWHQRLLPQMPTAQAHLNS